MIEFATSEVRNEAFVAEAACLVTPVDVLPDETNCIVSDGEKIELPRLVVASMVNAIRICSELESQEKAVDCSVFSILMMGGSYNPVNQEIYVHCLHRQIEYGRWVGDEELLDVPSAAQMIQFIHQVDGALFPKHTAVQLPENAGLFVQKVGNRLPIALTGAVDTLAMHTANHAATINSFRAGHREGEVLHFTSSKASDEPAAIYRGQPK